MRIVLLSLIVASLVIAAGRPQWISTPPRGYTNEFFVGYGTAATEDEARRKAMFNAIAAIVRNSRTTAQVNQSMQRLQNEQMTNGESVNSDEITRIVTEVVVVGESQSIEGLKEEEHYTEFADGTYTVFTLMRIPKPPGMQRKPPGSSDRIIRSFVPGWAQYYKGQSTKGLFIIGGEALTAGAGMYFLTLSSRYDTDARNAVTLSDQKFYTEKRDNATLSATAFLIGAGLLYIYNVIDGMESEGDKLYVGKYSIAPQIFPLTAQAIAGFQITIEL